MKDMWSYDKDKRTDRAGHRWHFVRHDLVDDRPSEERPVEWYFRDEERTVFGVFRIAHQKDFPYRDYLTMVKSIMNKPEVRAKLLDPETEGVWNKNWK